MNLEGLIPIIAIIVAVLAVVTMLFSMWKKVPQDEAGVITGLKKRVITGGGGLVIPGLERMDKISLGNIALKVETRGSLSSQGVPISVTTTAVIKVKNDTKSILTAVEQFSGRNMQEVRNAISQTATEVLEGKLREIIAGMTVEDLYKKREDFSSEVQKVVGTELATMGIEVKNFTITDISDDNGYIKALGEGMIAQRKKDAEIQKAEAKREQDEKTSEAFKLGEQAKIKANTEIKESEKDQAVRESEFAEEEARAKAKADLAHEIQTSITKKEVIAANAEATLLQEQKNEEIKSAEIQVQITEAAKNTELKEQLALEKEKELLSTVVKPAEAERLREQQVAEADKFKQVKKAEAEAEKKRIDADAEADAILKKAKANAEAIQAEAQANAEKIALEGKARAEATKAEMEAKAEGTKAQLIAEAEGLEKKAEALAKMNNAGITQMIIEQLPAIAREVAAPMAQVDKISIIGGNDGVGQVCDMVPTALTRVIETVKDTTGFDLVRVMEANTIEAQTDHNIIVDEAE